MTESCLRELCAPTDRRLPPYRPAMAGLGVSQTAAIERGKARLNELCIRELAEFCADEPDLRAAGSVPADLLAVLLTQLQAFSAFIVAEGPRASH
jgi:hypothetical protein